MTLTVLLADDHILFRQGLALLVGKQADWEIVGEADDGEAAVQLAQRLRPQIAVLDVEMPHMDGMEAARRIRQVSPETQIVALSMYGDAHYQERMFEAGASAYVLKNEAIDDAVFNRTYTQQSSMWDFGPSSSPEMWNLTAVPPPGISTGVVIPADPTDPTVVMRPCRDSTPASAESVPVRLVATSRPSTPLDVIPPARTREAACDGAPAGVSAPDRFSCTTEPMLCVSTVPEELTVPRAATETRWVRSELGAVTPLRTSCASIVTVPVGDTTPDTDAWDSPPIATGVTTPVGVMSPTTVCSEIDPIACGVTTPAGVDAPV